MQKCRVVHSLGTAPAPAALDADTKPESLEEAASLGVSTIQWVPPRMKVIRAAFDHYRDAYQRAQPSGRKPHIGLMREIYVAETDRQARDEIKDQWNYFWQRRGGGRAYGGYGHEERRTRR